MCHPLRWLFSANHIDLIFCSAMFSLLKSQIIKPFLQFTKDLSVDQLDLSVMKGEGCLKTLVLNEATLMNLINLPTWLNLRKACCFDIVFKIRWTKLESRPVTVTIDKVNIEVELLTVPRPDADSSTPSYRTGSGKYKLADRVVDGATVFINTVSVRFFAPAFEASIEISRVSLVSKTPSWDDGALNTTFLCYPTADAILVFKQLTWDSVRIVADGLLNELSGIPVKLITNGGRIRLTLKKRLSDASLISSRFHFVLDDLLWILTLSQVEACIVFLRSLQNSIFLATEQSKQFAASRAKRQTLSSAPYSSTRNLDHSSDARLRDPRSAFARVFHLHDVVETSYHLCLLRMEIHFCDETKNEADLASIPNGYIQVHVYDAEIDWYPYHLDVSPKVRWPGCRDYQQSRDTWLNNNLAYSMQVRGCRHLPPPVEYGTVTSSAYTVSSTVTDITPSIIQSLTVLRVADFDVSLVSFPGATRGRKLVDGLLHRYNDEVPLHKNLFIGSDKKLHCLPANTYLLTVEHRSAYRSRPHESNKTSDNWILEPLPCVFFGQLKPVFVRFDVDTVIWLNTFLLTLHKNLDIFLKYQALWTSSGQSDERKCYHIRGEALMPRIILPFNCSLRASADPADDNETTLPAPDVLVIQADELTVQLLVPPLSAPTANAVSRLSDVPTTTFCDPRSPAHVAHVPVDFSKFTRLLNDAENTPPMKLNATQWCLHIPHLWAEFLIVGRQTTGRINNQHAADESHVNVYRQSLLDPLFLTTWIALSFESDLNGQLEIIMDFDYPLHPIDPPNYNFHRLYSHSNNDPIMVQLGAAPTSNSVCCSIQSTPLNYPSASDHLLLLASLLSQLSVVLDQMTLGELRISSKQPATLTDKPNSTPVWLITILRLKRPIEIRLFIQDIDDASQRPDPGLDCPKLSTSVTSSIQQTVQDLAHRLETLHSNSLNSSSADINHSKEWELLVKRPDTYKGSQTDSVLSENLSEIDSPDDLIGMQRVLFNTEDQSSHSSNDLSVFCSTGHWLHHSQLSYPSSCAQETGVEVFANDSPIVPPSTKLRSHSLLRPDYTDVVIQNRLGPSTVHPSICLQLHNLSITSDVSSSEFRAWFELDELGVITQNSDAYSHTSPEKLHQENGSLWSFFWCTTVSATQTTNSDLILHKDVRLFGDLLRDWTVRLPSTLRCLIPRFTSHLYQLPLNAFFPPVHSDNSFICFRPSTSRICATLSLTNGQLEVDFGGNGVIDGIPSKICFDRGLCMSCTNDSVHIGNFSAQLKFCGDSHYNIETVLNTSSDLSGNLCDEIAFLRNKVDLLNAEVARLQCELRASSEQKTPCSDG